MLVLVLAQRIVKADPNWLFSQLEENVASLFPGCMEGRVMYAIPFSMGPIGSPLAKIGIELTDSAYVAVSMRIMTRVGSRVLQVLLLRLPGQSAHKQLHWEQGHIL